MEGGHTGKKRTAAEEETALTQLHVKMEHLVKESLLILNTVNVQVRDKPYSLI